MDYIRSIIYSFKSFILRNDIRDKKNQSTEETQTPLIAKTKTSRISKYSGDESDGYNYNEAIEKTHYLPGNESAPAPFDSTLLRIDSNRYDANVANRTIKQRFDETSKELYLYDTSETSRDATGLESSDSDIAIACESSRGFLESNLNAAKVKVTVDNLFDSETETKDNLSDSETKETKESSRVQHKPEILVSTPRPCSSYFFEATLKAAESAANKLSQMKNEESISIQYNSDTFISTSPSYGFLESTLKAAESAANKLSQMENKEINSIQQHKPEILVSTPQPHSSSFFEATLKAAESAASKLSQMENEKRNQVR